MRTAISIEEGIFEKTVVINFDGVDENGNLSHTGGYLRVTRDDDCQCYNVIIFNKHGDVLVEKYIEFDFEPIEAVY